MEVAATAATVVDLLSLGRLQTLAWTLKYTSRKDQIASRNSARNRDSMGTHAMYHPCCSSQRGSLPCFAALVPDIGSLQMTARTPKLTLFRPDMSSDSCLG